MARAGAVLGRRLYPVTAHPVHQHQRDQRWLVPVQWMGDPEPPRALPGQPALDGEPRRPLRKLGLAHRRRGAPSRERDAQGPGQPGRVPPGEGAQLSGARTLPGDADPIAQEPAATAFALGLEPRFRLLRHRAQYVGDLERRTGQRANPAMEQGFELYRRRNRIGPAHPGGGQGEPAGQNPQRQACILRLEALRPVREPIPHRRNVGALGPHQRRQRSERAHLVSHELERAEDAGDLGRSQRALRLQTVQSMAHVDQRQGQRQIVHVGGAMNQGNLVIALDPAAPIPLEDAAQPDHAVWLQLQRPQCAHGRSAQHPPARLEQLQDLALPHRRGVVEHPVDDQHLPRWFAAQGVEIAKADRREEFGVGADTTRLREPQ